jgi:arginase
MTRIHLVGVPLDLGAGRRGVDMGPSAIRIAGLRSRAAALGRAVVDVGDVPSPLPEASQPADKEKQYIHEIAAVCQQLYDRVGQSLDAGALPIVLGGDHSLAAGSVAASADWVRRTTSRPLGLIWLDAHGDMNTPASTDSGNVHGMALAHLLGLGDERLASVGGLRGKVEAENVSLIGVRDLDDREKKLVAESGVNVFTMKDIDRRGVSSVIEQAIETASRGTAGIHVSFDIDVVDPSLATGVGTPKKGGLTYREAHLCMEMVADSKRLVGIDLVEVNPILDTRNATAELGSELLLSALGKRIF